MGYYAYGGWPKYVSVAERKRQAEKKVNQLLKQGKKLDPIKIEGRTIAKTYWGKSWCENLESYSDYENRLPRGRTYVRNGMVIDLKIAPGSIIALVGGSSVYNIKIDIAALAKDKWQSIVKECSGKIDSIIELLKGKFSKSVMEVMTRKEQGLFPHPNEIKINCSCPDYAEVCKHVAAVFYGVGARLDISPELLFILRQVDHNELIVADGALETLISLDTKQKTFADDDLSNIFGIDIDTGATDDNMKKALPINIITEDYMEQTEKLRKTSKSKSTKKINKPQKIKKVEKKDKAKKTNKAKKVKNPKKTVKKVVGIGKTKKVEKLKETVKPGKRIKVLATKSKR